MQRTYSLKKNAQFKYVHRRGNSSGSHEMVLLYVPAGTLKVGFSVSGKVGNAVTRNRIRRCLREDVRRLRARMKCGKYVFIARASIAEVPHAALTRELRRLLERANLLKEEP